MILAILLGTLLAPIVQEQSGADLLQSRNFYMVGWYCDGEGCSSNPRRLSQNVRFDPARSNASLAEAEHLTVDWSIMLNCETAGDHFKNCRVEDDSVGPREATIVALRMMHSVRVKVMPKAQKSAGARAIISIQYAKGDCPPWYCAPTPPPPAPPPAQ